jgi:hypothetical protein
VIPPRPPYWQALPRPALATSENVGRLVLGREAREVGQLMPRLFNLCGAAQGAAARLALGLSSSESTADLTQEILRDHLMKLCLTWPRMLKLTPRPLPADWQVGGAALLWALFDGSFPDTPEALDAALDRGRGIAPVFSALRESIRPGLGAAPALPLPTSETVFVTSSLENSVAARQVSHPVLRATEALRGRDLYWRALARVFDLADAALGRMPAPRKVGAGRAVVPAARGAYAVEATVQDGLVTSFRRVTPTDHLLADGGILMSTLAGLSASDRDMIPLVLDILDPCAPLDIRPRMAREMADA